MEKIRVKWIDIAKFIGIFAIFLGHFGEVAGKGYLFVFQFHVVLFFILSGFTENFQKEDSIWKTLWKLVKEILIPFYVFSILSIILFIILNDCNIYSSLSLIKRGILLGSIRNSFFADSLWFLTCIFLVKVLFTFIKHIKNKMIIFLLYLFFFCICTFFLFPKYGNGSFLFLPYNIDSAFYYGFYYCIGYLSYPVISKLLLKDTKVKKGILVGSGILTSIFTFFLFEGINLFHYLPRNLILNVLYNILTPCIVVLLILIISKELEHVKFFCDIGKNSLYLCGSEWIIKTLVDALISLFGLSLTLQNILSVYLYTFLLLVLANYLITPILKKIINTCIRKIPV